MKNIIGDKKLKAAIKIVATQQPGWRELEDFILSINHPFPTQTAWNLYQQSKSDNEKKSLLNFIVHLSHRSAYEYIPEIIKNKNQILIALALLDQLFFREQISITEAEQALKLFDNKNPQQLRMIKFIRCQIRKRKIKSFLLNLLDRLMPNCELAL